MKSEDRKLLTAVDIADMAMMNVVKLLQARGDERWKGLSRMQTAFCMQLQAELVPAGEEISVQRPDPSSTHIEEPPEIDLSALPEGDQNTPGTRIWYGVHKTHCCLEHGCKYRDDDCPVANGKIKQSGPCETCGLEREGYFGRETQEAAQIRDELVVLRARHGKFMRRIKKTLGYQNWPDLSGDFLDAVADLLEQRLGQLANEAKQAQIERSEAE